MKPRTDLLDQASMTVERTGKLLRDLCDQLDSTAGMVNGEHRSAWDAITDVEWRHSLLSDLYLDMMLCPPSELPQRWHRFSTYYDDFREAVREARSLLAQDDYQHEAHGPAAATAPSAAIFHRAAGP
ncbi:MAG TPA: hypothetical protein VIK70_03380 [Lysobacter sp.]